MESPNFWKEDFARMMNGDQTVNELQDMLSLCGKWLSEENKREDIFKILSFVIQLRVSIAILTKLDQLKEEL